MNYMIATPWTIDLRNHAKAGNCSLNARRDKTTAPLQTGWLWRNAYSNSWRTGRRKGRQENNQAAAWRTSEAQNTKKKKKKKKKKSDVIWEGWGMAQKHKPSGMRVFSARGLSHISGQISRAQEGHSGHWCAGGSREDCMKCSGCKMCGFECQVEEWHIVS